MSNAESYQNVILGSGEGGKYLAWHLASSGQRTAVIERRWIGGSCPNINCLPSKNEIWSAEVAHLVRNALAFGVLAADPQVDMNRVRARKREMVEQLVAMHLRRFKESGVELVMGSGRFVEPNTIAVRMNDGGTRVLRGDRIFLSTGTRAVIPDVAGLSDAEPLTHTEALELADLPEHLIVLGAGYVGLEFAQAYRRFGARVTVIERGPRLAGREDADVSDEITHVLQGEGIDILVSAEVSRVAGRSGDRVSLCVRVNQEELTLEGSHILAAAGRSPNTSGIGLDIAGVALDARGYIQVNERLETTAPDVWALGECAGSPQFTHAAFDDFRIIRDNLAGRSRVASDRLMPYCMFTDPPLGRVGLSETDASRVGIAVRVAKLPVSAVLRALTTSETSGFLKVLVGADDDRLLGFAMLGADAGEVMAVVQTAMIAGLPFTALRDAVIAHPTMAEGLIALLSKVPARPD